MAQMPPTPRVVKWSLLVLAVIATIAALKLGKTLLAPVALGLVIAVVLAPIVRKLDKIGVPKSISALTVLALTGISFVILIIALGPVIRELIQQIPRIQWEMRGWLREMAEIARGAGSIGREIEETLTRESENAVGEAMPDLIDALWLAPNFFAQLLIFSGTLFFFLITRDELYDCTGEHCQALRAADRSVSHYFVTITLINVGLGVATFGAMTLIGMGNPVLWGAAAFILNFVLYLGPTALIGALFVAGMIQFDGAYSFLPPVAFLMLNLTEAQFVTPSLVGHRMRINPLFVFLAILAGLWLWGPVGAVVALPFVIWATAWVLYKPEPETDAAEDRKLRAV